MMRIAALRFLYRGGRFTGLERKLRLCTETELLEMKFSVHGQN